MKRLIQLFLILVLAVSMQSCVKENNNAPQNLDAPEIPSTVFLNIPTQSFGLTSDKETSSTRNDKSNWIHAGLNVLVWNTVVFANTAVPINAFSRAIDHEAKFIGDLTWEWSYIFKAPVKDGGDVYDVTLTGQYISNNEEVDWTMTVKNQANNNKFVWYEGVTSKRNLTGNFTINKSPNNPQAYMNLSYTRTAESSDISIRFSNVQQGDPGQGDYIEWRTTEGAEYDRAYDVFTKNNLLEIESNSVIDNGRVKDPKHFNDSEWHCWGANKVSIDCQ